MQLKKTNWMTDMLYLAKIERERNSSRQGPATTAKINESNIGKNSLLIKITNKLYAMSKAIVNAIMYIQRTTYKGYSKR